jgi:hypothetical protein
MCARRFLMAIFVLTLLVVAGAFAIFEWGGQLLLDSRGTPAGHFEASAAGRGPDYADASNWIALPKLGRSPADWLPDGVEAGPKSDAAVFYIHPTTYLRRDRWNAPLNPGSDTELRTRLFLQSQASAFNASGEIWAPRYRQAAFGAFLLSSKDARQALDLAYSDIEAAFDRFTAEAGTGPIILAAHSQGALHLARLLEDKIAGKPIAKRIVAAYVVGWPLSVTADLPAMGLPPCAGPEETGCVLSWMSFADPANPDLVLHPYLRSEGFAGGKRKREDLLCVNPISGVRDGAAAAAANPGTMVPSADLLSARLDPGIVGAHCDRGLLIIDGQIPSLGPYVLPGNNYHVYDYALFWGAIRRDAARRHAAWNGR